MFNPSEVFRTLYRQACLLGINEFASSKQLSSELICGDIEAHIISMFSFMKFTGQSAATLRQQGLQQNSQYWQLLKSNIDCFICLQRKPEHMTECGHGICDLCISIRNFSTPTKGREYCYNVSNCPQCQAQIRLQVRTLPPTCRARFLGIDGGGSRGIVSLGFMEELRLALGLHYPVQENFDYSIGTSSGEFLNAPLGSDVNTEKVVLQPSGSLVETGPRRNVSHSFGSLRGSSSHSRLESGIQSAQLSGVCLHFILRMVNIRRQSWKTLLRRHLGWILYSVLRR